MAKFKVGDRVRDTEAMRDGVIVEIDAEKPGYYAVKYDTRPQPQWNVPGNYLTLANSAPCRSTNAVVQKAINARTARKEGVGKLKVTMQTITFQGRKSETRILTLAKLEELMKALGHSDLIQSVLQSLTTRGNADFEVDAVEVDVLAL